MFKHSVVPAEGILSKDPRSKLLFIAVITVKRTRLNPPLICLIRKLRLPPTRDDGNPTTGAFNAKTRWDCEAKCTLLSETDLVGLQSHGYETVISAGGCFSEDALGNDMLPGQIFHFG